MGCTALLEADVAYDVVNQFLDRVVADAVGKGARRGSIRRSKSLGLCTVNSSI